MADEEKRPLDQIVESFMSDHEEGGWIVSCARDMAPEKEAYEIKLTRELQPIDERLQLAKRPNHKLATPMSLVRYADKYGSQEHTTIYVGEESVVCCMNERIERGALDFVTVERVDSRFFEAWLEILGSENHPKKLRSVLQGLRRTILDPEIISALNQIQFTEQLDVDKEVTDDGFKIGIMFKGIAGERMRSFPKKFPIAVPVLDTDVVDESVWIHTEVTVEINYPEKQGEGVRMVLYADDLEIAGRQRWEESVRKAIAASANPEKLHIFEGVPEWRDQIFAKK